MLNFFAKSGSFHAYMLSYMFFFYKHGVNSNEARSCLYQIAIFLTSTPSINPIVGLKCLVYHCAISFFITFIFWKIWQIGKFILSKSEPHHAYSCHAYKKKHVFLIGHLIGQILSLVHVFFISMTAIISMMMRLRFCQNELAKSSYLPKYKSYEETNFAVIKGFQN